MTAKARRCVVAERQKGTFKSEPIEERSTRPEPIDDQVQSSRRYSGPAPTTLFQTRQHVLKVRRSGTGNQCKVSMIADDMCPNFGIRRSSSSIVDI